jgi:glutaredoxin-like protein
MWSLQPPEVTFMPIISDDDAAQIKALFEERLEGPVTLVHFTQKESKLVIPGVVPCAGCRDALQLLEELVVLDGRLSLELHDFAAEAELAQEMGIDHIPATVVRGQGDGDRVRLLGVPSGYEFSTLLEDIFDASAGAPELPAAVSEALEGLEHDVHIQVFVTPTCPYCPTAVHGAHVLARGSERVTADMVMAGEFPDLAQRYGVMAVPKTVINGTHAFEGAVPDEDVVRAVLEAVGAEVPELPAE